MYDNTHHHNALNAPVNALLVIISALLASLAFPPYELWPVAWICFIPLLAALRRTESIRASGWLALLFGVVFLSVTLRWLSAIFGTGMVGVALLGSLPFILFGLAYRLTWKYSPANVAALMTPVLWLAVDWLRCDGWYFRFSWAQLGFTQVNSPFGTRLYPLIGVYGVTFLIVLVNSGLSALFLRPPKSRPLAISLIVVVICLIGAILIQLPPGASGFSVCAVQDESGDMDTLKQLTRKADLVVWPEYSVPEYPLSRPILLSELRETAKSSKGVLVVGCKQHAPRNARCDWFRRRAMGAELFYNTALVIDRDGRIVGIYHKKHPIQLFADGVPGQSGPVFMTDYISIGIAICYDFDFASSSLNLVRNDARILVVPTFDPASWGHSTRANGAGASGGSRQVGGPSDFIGNNADH